MECYDVDFYHKENGDCPVDDFLESLDTKMRAKVLGAVALLEANGPQLREPYSKFIGDGIFEILGVRYKGPLPLTGRLDYQNFFWENF